MSYFTAGVELLYLEFSMVRSELAELLHERFPKFTRGDIDAAIAVIIDGVAETLAAGGRVEIRGFGVFSLNHRPPRIGRNPATGAAVNVPAKWTPHFKPGKELREAVDRQL